MGGYDNDTMLLMLDDDLFWREKGDQECGDTISQIQPTSMLEIALSEASAR